MPEMMTQTPLSRTSEGQFYAAMVSDSEDAIVGSADGIVVTWNRGAETLYGYTRAEALGMHVSRLAPPEMADHVALVLRRLAEGDRFTQFKAHGVRKDGTRFPISLTMSPVRDDAGRIVGVTAISRDMSALHSAERAVEDAEERMRFALDAARIGVWEVNLATGQVFWSETCEALYGLAPGTFEKTFDAFIARVHPEDRQQVLERLNESRVRHTATEIEFRTIWPDGSERWIRASVQYLYDAAGTPIRAAGVVKDITERRVLEDQLRQAQKMEAVGQLAGGVAHDFNNMLTAILGNSEYVLDQLSGDDPRRVNLEEIQTAAKRAASLTHQLLAFSRKQILKPRVLHLGDVVNGIMPMLRRLLGEPINLKAVTWDCGRVKADAMQVEQVLLNLAVNARDAMPDGGRLTIETSDVELDAEYAREHPYVTPGSYVMIAVTDTGHGMDAATRTRLFEPFFTTKPKGRGTGLGLATVYGIAKQSGGHIHVYSEVGCGTTFKFYLPRTDEVDDARHPTVEIQRPLHGKERVLLVEDEDVVRHFAHRVLENYGYTVHSVANPREALALVAGGESRIDVIVTDVVLPDMNGRSLAAMLRETEPHAKVLYMSGYADHAIVHHGVLEPGMKFLPKPFSAEALARSVRDTLESRSA